ncbi:MAG TPA: ADP-polyphosphate phosphotransferase [Burkholderiales bacterium]|nr:ADP-polyphosphate phosphotransferase [Burkholderiales bacterium]
MKIKTGDYRVKRGDKVDLSKWPTKVKKYYGSEDDYEKQLAEHVGKLSELQPVLYADHRYALLVMFQAMDAAGKDGAIKHVMSGVNPQGCVVYSFKHPGPEALKHDFLWQASQQLPGRGHIGIFNRSYYEEVLIVRVHRELLEAQSLPKEADGKDVWSKRYRSIRDFEKHLYAGGTRIVKIFLHLSKEEQRERFLARLDEADKNWKFNEGDLTERAYWDDYMKAYEACLGETSVKHAPWYVVPADDKHNARLIVSKILIEALEAIPMSYPKVDAKRRKELAEIRKRLEAGDV